MSMIADDVDSVPKDGRTIKLVLLGDYIDRGNQSRSVVEVLYQACMEAKSLPIGQRPVFLKGNHEAALLAFLDEPERHRSWLRFGGLQTLASYGVPIPSMGARLSELTDTAQRLKGTMGPHFEFLSSLPLLYRSGDVICVHAGLDPGNPASRDERAVLWGETSFLEKGSIPGVCIVHGHYAVSDALVSPDRICLDTGAYYSGKLTAARIDDEVKILEARDPG